MIGNQDYNFKFERFEIDSNGCHLWLLSLDKDGYGKEWDNLTKKTRPAHILTYERK